VVTGLSLLAAGAVAAQAAKSRHALDGAKMGLGPGVAVPSWAVGRRIHFFAARHEGSGATTNLRGPISEQGLSRGVHNRAEEVFGTEPPLTYHGGLGVQHSPKIFIIFWGSNWNKEPGSALRTQLEKMYKGLSGSTYQDILTQYFDGTGRVSSTVAVASPFTDERVTAPTEVSDAEVKSKIQEEIEYALSPASKTGWTADSNAQFVVVPAPGSTYAPGTEGFCGYHSVTKNGGWSYTFYPYEGDEPFQRQCSFYDKNHNVDNVTTTAAAHEYAESATDPQVVPSTNATWYTASGYEIGDICATGDIEIKEGALSGSWVQKLWDNDQNVCSLSDPTPPYVYAFTENNEPTGSLETKVVPGTVYAEKLQTSYYVEYGFTTSYGQRSPAQVLSGSTITASVNQTISGLVDGELYHYRIVATNETGTIYGKDKTFRTGPYQEWRVNGEGLTQPRSVKVTGEISFGEFFPSPYVDRIGMSCHFSAEGTVIGTSGTISAMSLSSCYTLGYECLTVKAVSVRNLPWKLQLYESWDGQSERIRFAPEGNGQPMWTLECEQHNEYDQWSGEPAFPIESRENEVFTSFKGYVVMQTYYGPYGRDIEPSWMKIKTVDGSPLAVGLPTLPAQTPSVTTLPGSNPMSAAATLNGAVNPRRGATTYRFEYDTRQYLEGEEPHGTRVPAPEGTAGAGVEPVTESQTVTGLSAGIYHYRIVASNAKGTVYGKDETVVVTVPPVYSSAFGSFGTGAGQFKEPADLKTDASGNVWVADTMNSRIEEFNSGGGFVRQFGSLGSGNGQFVAPYGLAIDSSGNVWVSDSDKHRIEEFNSEGVFQHTYGSYGSGEMQFYEPEGITVDSSGNVFVADRGNKRVEEFTSAGVYVRSFSDTEMESGPTDVARDSSGDLWVVYKSDNKIVEFSSGGSVLFAFGTKGSGSGQLLGPDRLTVGSEGNIWVTEYSNNRVQVFSPAGEYRFGFGGLGSGTGQFWHARGIGISGANVYVLDSGEWNINSGNSRVEKWTY
jgi:streptogramin lyase